MIYTEIIFSFGHPNSPFSTYDTSFDAVADHLNINILL